MKLKKIYQKIKSVAFVTSSSSDGGNNLDGIRAMLEIVKMSKKN